MNSFPAAYTPSLSSESDPSSSNLACHTSIQTETANSCTSALVPGRERPLSRYPPELPHPRLHVQGPDFLLDPRARVPGSDFPQGDTNTNGPHVQCTEHNTSVDVSPNELTPLFLRATPQSVLQKLKIHISNHPCWCAWSVIWVLLVVAIIIACVTTMAVLGPCKEYSTQFSIFTNDTILKDIAGIDSSCHTALIGSEAAAQDDFIVQEIQLYTVDCADVRTQTEPVRHNLYNYENLTGSFAIYSGPLYYSMNSNLSVDIKASTPAGQSSEVIICIFDNATNFIEFSTNQKHWKEYIKYAVSCNKTVVNTTEPVWIKAFGFNFKKPEYYSIGLGSYQVLSHLDISLYGERFLYDTSNANLTNCTFRTPTDSCTLPQLASGELPCILAHADISPELLRGFSRVQLNSKGTLTLQHWGLLILVPCVVVLVALVAFCLWFVLCCWKTN